MGLGRIAAPSGKRCRDFNLKFGGSARKVRRLPAERTRLMARAHIQLLWLMLRRWAAERSSACEGVFVPLVGIPHAVR
jgi:hypothetical protein